MALGVEGTGMVNTRVAVGSAGAFFPRGSGESDSPADSSRVRLITFSARDGLRLHAECYEAAASNRRPVLCLAGLTRNGRDFRDLALALSGGQEPRRVYTLDSRGRGLSESDRDWKNYSIPVEMQDVIDFAALTGLHGATVIGTSRGGLIAMVLAAAQPSILGAVVLNDIGPVIERDGLSRIAGYVGRMPLPGSWAEAGEIVAGMNRRNFPAVSPEQWERVAHAWFNEQDGRPARGYDPKLGRSISVKDGPVPELWEQFAALGDLPLLAIRGENSDILSAATFAQMQKRHPDCALIDVPGEGHAPLLMDGRSIGAIARFLSAVDAGERVGGRDFAVGV